MSAKRHIHFSVRMTTELRDQIRRAADCDERSASSWVRLNLARAAHEILTANTGAHSPEIEEASP